MAAALLPQVLFWGKGALKVVGLLSNHKPASTTPGSQPPRIFSFWKLFAGWGPFIIVNAILIPLIKTSKLFTEKLGGYDSLGCYFKDSQRICTDNFTEYESALTHANTKKKGALALRCWMTAFESPAYVSTVTCNPSLLGDYRIPGSYNRLNGKKDTLRVEFGTAGAMKIEPGRFSLPHIDVKTSVSFPKGYSTLEYPSGSWGPTNLLAWDVTAKNGSSVLDDLPKSSFTVNCGIKLNWRFIGFAYVLFISMWVVSVATLVLVVIFVHARKYKPSVMKFKEDAAVRWPLLAFSGALLFALPAMRALLPMAPPMGMSYDLNGVYGQLLVVSISTWYLASDSTRYLAEHYEDAKAKVNQAKEKERERE